jgi:hypothetical protein
MVYLKVLFRNLYGGTEESHVNISHDIECRGRDICAHLPHLLHVITKVISSIFYICTFVSAQKVATPQHRKRLRVELSGESLVICGSCSVWKDIDVKSPRSRHTGFQEKLYDSRLVSRMQFLHLNICILSQDRVTIDWVWIDNWIYCTFETRNYY